MRTWPARRDPWILAASLLLFLLIAILLAIGLSEPARWSNWNDVEIIGRTASGQWLVPPLRPLTAVDAYSRVGGTFGHHFYWLGSDGGGRDLLALLAHGSLPSLLLIACALVGRMAVGMAAGIAMGLGSRTVRSLSRGMGRWVAGFPYLALAVVLIQALSPNPARRSLIGFAAAMALVGWRDIAEVTADRIQSVLVEDYSIAARALGTGGVRLFRRHVIPHLRPALLVEIPLQASATLVLLGELGYLGFYLGGNPLIWGEEAGPGSGGYRLVQLPEMGQLLSAARDYILREQWVPVLVPALALAALALAFELLGLSLRARAEARR